jgi:hypothetical protein
LRHDEVIDGVLGFDLEPKATHGHAVAVADFLNRNIAAQAKRAPKRLKGHSRKLDYEMA